MRYLVFILSLVVFSSCYHTAKKSSAGVEKPSVYEEDRHVVETQRFTVVENAVVVSLPVYRAFYLETDRDGIFSRLIGVVVVEAEPEKKDAYVFSFPKVPTVKPSCKKRKAVLDQNRVFLYFDFNSKKLKKKEKLKLNVFLNRVKKKGIKKLRVIGYTDKVGSKEYNDRLAKERAKAVASYIRNKLPGLDLFVDGYGKCCYISEDDAKNRRVEVDSD